MDKLDRLKTIRLNALMTKNTLLTDQTAELMIAHAEMEMLIDRYREEFPERISPEQVKRAKDDYDYFMYLLEEACGVKSTPTDRVA